MDPAGHERVRDPCMLFQAQQIMYEWIILTVRVQTPLFSVGPTGRDLT